MYIKKLPINRAAAVSDVSSYMYIAKKHKQAGTHGHASEICFIFMPMFYR
jgi:hypothetical protein